MSKCWNLFIAYFYDYKDEDGNTKKGTLEDARLLYNAIENCEINGQKIEIYFHPVSNPYGQFGETPNIVSKCDSLILLANKNIPRDDGGLILKLDKEGLLKFLYEELDSFAACKNFRKSPDIAAKILVCDEWSLNEASALFTIFNNRNHFALALNKTETYNEIIEWQRHIAEKKAKERHTNAFKECNINIREKELFYLKDRINVWKNQLNEKVNIKKIVELNAFEYKSHSIDAEEISSVDSMNDIDELNIHTVEMHYQYESSSNPTDNVCECVQNNDGKVVLLGEPGSGKSVALLKIAIEYAKKAINNDIALIPILVPLGAYRGDKDIDTFTLGFLRELKEYYSAENVKNRVIKIFDALNETISDTIYSVIDYIKKQRKFIISCRILDYKESFSNIRGVTTIEILPLDPIRIRDAVTNDLWEQLGGNDYIISAWNKITKTSSDGHKKFWYYKREVDLFSDEIGGMNEYRQMIEKIDFSPNELNAYKSMIDKGVMPLCSNPLMLSIACGLYSNNKLPDTRGKLIKEFVRKSIEDELKRRKITDFQIVLQISDVLKMIARIIQERRIGTDNLKISDIINENNDTDVLKFALDVARNAGVLAKDVSEENNIKFYHQLFQEYFASMALQDIINETNELSEVNFFDKEKWWNPTGWDETVVLLSEATSKKEFDTLLLWLARFQPLLTVRCIENRRDFDPQAKTIDKIRSMWVTRIANEVKSPDKRYSIAKTGEALSRIGDKRKGIGITSSVLNGKRFDSPNIDWRTTDMLPVYVSRNLITVEQYFTFLEDDGYNYSTGIWSDIADFDNNLIFSNTKEKKADNLNKPVVGITWFEAYAFCNWLSRKTGDIIRLPTSSEWKLVFDQNFNKSLDNKENMSQIFNVSEDNGEGSLTASGIYSISELTLVEDLIGNVWEWCSDRIVYNDDYDPLLDDNKPITTRILKGGSWRYRKEYATSSFILYSYPDCIRSDVGFRIVKSKNNS